jgi:hypothetical protein
MFEAAQPRDDGGHRRGDDGGLERAEREAE